MEKTIRTINLGQEIYRKLKILSDSDFFSFSEMCRDLLVRGLNCYVAEKSNAEAFLEEINKRVKRVMS